MQTNPYDKFDKPDTVPGLEIDPDSTKGDQDERYERTNTGRASVNVRVLSDA